MSKIRIYELAKELGVDNKIVINAATIVGVPGKLSHSNSLEADEADQIRRAVIRQALGSSPESQVVKKSVNRVTGETATIVESRKGNVIRRRKRDGVDEEPQSQPEAPVLEAVAEPVEEEPVLVEEVLPEPVEVLVEAEAVVEPASPEPTPEVVVPERAEKPALGPRVLGKILLPVKKVIKPAPKKTQAFSGGAALQMRTDDREEDSDGRGDSRKKKTKKREISRLELVDYEGRAPRRITKGKSARKESSLEPQQVGPRVNKPVKISGDTIIVGDLARQMSVKAAEIIAKLIELGVFASINQAVDLDTATLLAEEFGFTVEQTAFDETDLLEEKLEDDSSNLMPRPPVATVMGHVDHGKTTLLDMIRKTSVAAKEHGGITQHIGAYSVALDKERSITFIDTPGHAAFTSMRARGAQVTDVVILVVAADDGVMPQTIEAINHAKAAGVPIVVAVNKIDKPGVSPDRLKTQLAEHGLNPEEWGGDTMYFSVSALKGTGIKELLEGLLLVVEMKDLKANPHRRAKGTVIEARQDKGRGSVATILIQNGTLKVGDTFVSGAEYGRIRSMSDSNGVKLEEAGPSTPVEVTGLSGVPFAGDDFFVVENEADARQVTTERANKRLAKEQRALATGPISLEEFARRANNMTALTLNVILKTDVHGSLEAARTAIEQLSGDKVKVRVIHAAVGGVSESDVQLAIASGAIIVGFGVRCESRVQTEAEQAGIELRFYRIIYEMIDEIKNAMAGLLAPVRKEEHLGRVEVRNTFNIPKIGMIAGCYVTEGMVKRGAMLRLLRDSKVIYEGKMSSLKRFKDDVKEVQSGYECGMSIEGYNDIKTGDVIEAYQISESAATLD